MNGIAADRLGTFIALKPGRNVAVVIVGFAEDFAVVRYQKSQTVLGSRFMLLVRMLGPAASGCYGENR